MIYYDTNWTEVRRVTRTNPFSWTLGEGHGLLTDSQRRPLAYDQDGRSSYVLAASTVLDAADTTLWAPWVAGDLKYLVFPRAVPLRSANCRATGLPPGTPLISASWLQMRKSPPPRSSMR